MGLEWDSVLKLGAFGACLMVIILVISFFVGITHNLFWFSLQLIITVLFFLIVLVSWKALKKAVNTE